MNLVLALFTNTTPVTALQVEIIASRCDELRFHNISRDHIRFALLSKYSEGDVDKAIDLIRLQQQAFSGILLPYNPDVEMVGAENREFVTCYLDALLFAMYAKLEAFDCMLKNEQLDENQRNLAALVRLWVNMLRSGKLIRTDMVCFYRGERFITRPAHLLITTAD